MPFDIFSQRFYMLKLDGVSAKEKEIEMIAERVLNHLLPTVAIVEPNIMLKIEHKDE